MSDWLIFLLGVLLVLTPEILPDIWPGLRVILYVLGWVIVLGFALNHFILKQRRRRLAAPIVTILIGVLILVGGVLWLYSENIKPKPDIWLYDAAQYVVTRDWDAEQIVGYGKEVTRLYIEGTTMIRSEANVQTGEKKVIRYTPEEEALAIRGGRTAKLNDAFDELRQKAIEGLPIWSVQDADKLPEPITKDYWERYSVEKIEDLKQSFYNKDGLMTIKQNKENQLNKPLYHSLRTNKAKIEEIWPPIIKTSSSNKAQEPQKSEGTSLLLTEPKNRYSLTWNPPDNLEIVTQPILNEGDKSPNSRLPIFNIKNTEDRILQEIVINWDVSDPPLIQIAKSSNTLKGYLREIDQTYIKFTVTNNGVDTNVKYPLSLVQMVEHHKYINNYGELEIEIPPAIYNVIEVYFISNMPFNANTMTTREMMFYATLSYLDNDKTFFKKYEIEAIARSVRPWSSSGDVKIPMNDNMVDPPQIMMEVSFNVSG